jgi:type I restriction enzyme, S subunit
LTWPAAKLSDVAPAKPLKPVFVEDDPDVWQITLDHIEADTGKILKRSISPVSEAGTSTHWFDENYVLYSKLRPYLNKVLLPDRVGLGTTELVPMLPQKGLLDRRYLAHYLRSPRFVSWVSSQTAGAKMPRVSMKVFWEHEIPLPPLEEQKRIAVILDKADNVRRKRQQAIELADEFLRAVFLDMFGDPVTNPRGWGCRKLESLTEKSITYGILKPEEYVPNGIAMLRIQDIKEGTVQTNALHLVSARLSEQYARTILVGGEIVISLVGTVGLVARVPHSLCGSNVHRNLGVIKLADESLNIFVLSFMQMPQFKFILERVCRGGVHKLLNLADLKEIEIPMPDPDLIESFTNIWTKVQELQRKNNTFCSDLLFGSLSQKAFLGEL